MAPDTPHRRRRRSSPFPGVPAPGGHDVDETHAYPGLAAELRDEPRDPAMSEPVDLGRGVRLDVERGPDTPTTQADVVTLRDETTEPATEHRARVDEAHTDAQGGTHVTLTPLDEQGRPSAEPFSFLGDVDLSGVSAGLDEPVEADLWGGDRPGLGHLGLADRSADVEPADVEQWRAEVEPEPTVAPELAAALPEQPVGVERPQGFERINRPRGVEDDLAGVTRDVSGRPTDQGGPAPQPDEGHRGPEWRRVIDPTDEPVEVRFACGCSFTLRPCRT